ncbi:MAG: DUF4956 domain-containing protein [Bacteroidota bacterium]
MNKTKFLIAILLFLCIGSPVYESIAQVIPISQETTIQTEENSDVTSKKDKKKDKESDKDPVDIGIKFVLYLLINVGTLAIIILGIYYPNNKQMETVFTFIMFNLMIFMLTFVLNKIKISMGAAFGLFAVFSMLRYRTEGISMKDMTYLFIFIAIGLISAIQLEFAELGVISGTVILFTFLLDSKFLLKREHSKRIAYENIELIKPENRADLIEDIKNRTGLNVRRINIERIDFLKDTAEIIVYYYE